MSKINTVLGYLETRTGLEVTNIDIASGTGLSAHEVAGAIAGLRRRGYDIISPTKGRYMFRGGPTRAAGTNGSIFELVGSSRTGRLVIQDESGNLYVAEAL